MKNHKNLVRIASAIVGVLLSTSTLMLAEQRTIFASGSNQESSAPQIDLSGLWAYQRKGGRTKGIVKGTLELSRASDLDKDDGYTAYRGVKRQDNPPAARKESPWIVAIKGEKIVVCMEGLCAAFPCAGSLTKEGEIVARCRFIGFSAPGESGEDLGEFRAKRFQPENSPTPNQ